jgi:hypothetical protein
MDTFAYCSRSFGPRIARLAGTAPVLCPPTTAETFDLRVLAGRDFVWFKLHGRRNERYWYGDNWTTALSADRLSQADLRGAVVFVSNCWLYDNRQGLDVPGPMMIALARANARAVIGGAGINYARNNRIAGSDLLGLYVRTFLKLGLGAWRAFTLAQVRLALARHDKVNDDTRGFRVWMGGKG